MVDKREWEKKRLEQKSEIAAMVSSVDDIAASYERFENTYIIINFSDSRYEVPDNLFTWVEVMITIWLLCV